MRALGVVALGLAVVATAQESVVATYDPRAIAIAYRGSEAFRAELFRLLDDQQAARARGDVKAQRGAEAEAQVALERLEEQVLGTRAVDDLLSGAKGSLDSALAAAGAARAVPWWDAPAGASQVDVTETLVDAFSPRADERARALAAVAEPRPVPGVRPRVVSLLPSGLGEPMYGGGERDPYLALADAWFVDRTAAQFGGRKAASATWCDRAFELYLQDQNDVALARFNQAWLLDPENFEVYWGFASILHDRGRNCEAAELMDRAVSFGQSGQGILADAGRIRLLCGARGAGFDEARRAEEREKARLLFERAEQVDPGLDYVYETWARSLLTSGDPGGAREIAARAAQRGVKLSKELRKDLDRAAR